MNPRGPGGGHSAGFTSSAMQHVQNLMGSAAVLNSVPIASASAVPFPSFWRNEFSGAIPPDILDTDQWMRKEGWNLGRLKDREYKPTFRVKLDRLIDDSYSSAGLMIEVVPGEEGDPEFLTHTNATGGVTIEVRDDVWDELVNEIVGERFSLRFGEPALHYKGVPVYRLPF